MKMRLFLMLVLVGSIASSANAQSFFWSAEDLGGGMLSEGDLNITAEIGDTGTAYLYYNPNGQDIGEGIDMDFSWDSGAAEFTGARTLDYDIEIAMTPFSPRWGDFTGDAVVTPNTVNDFLAINVVAGTGLLVSQSTDGPGPFFDTGSQGGFFQIGSVDWAAAGVGTANLVVDGSLVVNGGNNIDAAFSGLSISVVPEPTSAALLGLGLVGLVVRRKR